MTFANPKLLWLLAAIPPAMLLFFWWSWRERRRLMAQFIQSRLLPNLIAGVSTARQQIRAACLIAAVALLILALGAPQWGYHLDEVIQRGLDIVVAVDTSKSMLAEDIAPNRLERAKLAVLDLMQQAKSDRMGLVAFAGTAFLECPLTVDDSAFRQSVEALNVNTLPEGGTAIGEAIDTALKAFQKSDNYKVLVLFTDGEDHDSGALDAAKRAADKGMHIFTIGIGSAEGELLRVKGANGQTDYIRDENGNVVKSRLNEALLQDIASAASGFYLPLRGANTMDVLYQKGLAPLPKSESKEQWVRRPIERYHWPLALAIVLLTVEMLLPERKRVARKPPAPSLKPALARAAVLVLLLVPMLAFGSASGALREYKAGKYDKAYQEYERLLQKNADDQRLQFNAGAAAYRNRQFNDALRHFGEALTSQDLKLQEQAYYNLGNTLFHLGENSPDMSRKSETWEKALTNYQSSIKLDPQDADAKYNFDFVKKKLEELKKQQQQQQKSGQNKDQQDKNQQNQKNQQSQNDQQKNSQSQQQQQNQKQNSSQQQQAANQQKKDQEQKKQEEAQREKEEQQKQQQAKAAQGQQRKNENSADQQKTAKAYAAGEMTPDEARQLLDSQKGDELLLPAKPEGRSSPQSGPVKDW